jgi:hypothetical protein
MDSTFWVNIYDGKNLRSSVSTRRARARRGRSVVSVLRFRFNCGVEIEPNGARKFRIITELRED